MRNQQKEVREVTLPASHLTNHHDERTERAREEDATSNSWELISLD